MYESPSSLQDVCLDYICDNIDALCEVQTNLDDGQAVMSFRSDDIFFHSNLSDLLLDYLCSKNKLTDQTMTLFDAQVTSLRHVRIKDAPLTSKGLRVLKPHKIIEMEATGVKDMTVNDIIGCLGEWTLHNLRILNVSNSTFLNAHKFCVVISLAQLSNLHSLNVSNTEFNKHGLDIIAQDLTSLESIDISNTLINDLSPLRKCKGRLKSLTMYNLRAATTEDIVSILCDMALLRHLDVSDDFSVQPFVNLHPAKFPIQELLQRNKSLPFLQSLDISGKDGVTEPLLKDYLMAHPNIRFLGLALTKACELPLFADEEMQERKSSIKVTGEASEEQLTESLKRYPNRNMYVQQTLYHLFSLTHGFVEPRIDIIKLIIPVMKIHPRELGVQMAATACIYNLTKGEMGQKIHPSWLAKIVDLTLDAMENFPNHQQLQKNALLTLCSDRILQDVSFNRFRCAQLVMDSLCSFNDHSMNRMSVAIVSILAAKIPTEQTSKLGARSMYMKKLLMIVKEKMEAKAADITMKFTLSALWNLTDESPCTCQMFLNEGGLDLFLTVIETYKELSSDIRIQVETKVLGLINNLAEVKMLRNALMRDDVLQMVHDLLQSEHIDVSYFAAGIVSHLSIDGPDSWTVTSIPRSQMMETLKKSVMNWEQPQAEMVAYRSFSPFFPLLSHFDVPQVQLWAVWAIQHVCTKNSSRYCPMLVSEKGTEMMNYLVKNCESDSDVVRLAQSVLDLVEKEAINSEEKSSQ